MPLEKIPFSYALDALKHGEEVTRDGWNGRGMYLFLSANNPTQHRSWPTPYRVAEDGPPVAINADRFHLEPHIVMKTADNKFVPWLASQTDILANDWIVLPRR